MKPGTSLIRVAALLASVMCLHVSVFSQDPAKPDSTPRLSKDARFRSLDGGSIKLSGYEDKVVVLAIWATWCYPCLKAVEKLKELPAAVSADSVAVIALSTELPGSAEVVLQSVASLGIKYPVGWISPISADKLMGEKKAIPQVYVIRSGEVLVKFVGWNTDQTFARVVEQVNNTLTSKP